VLGLHHLIASCLSQLGGRAPGNDACTPSAVIDVSSYPGRHRGAVVHRAKSALRRRLKG
jgi:hypothetical protein